MTHGLLFAGIGGFGIAAQWAGIENVWANEIDPWCCKVLKKNFPKLQIYEEDIRKINPEPVDIITGGFPCQPFSHAGKRKGKEDYRYLWPEMFRVVRDNKRKQEERGKGSWVIVENVTGLLSMGDGGTFEGLQPRVENKEIIRQEDYDQFVKIFSLEEIMLLESICQDLEQAGYSVQPYSIPACSVGAWHRRDRIWIIANTIISRTTENIHARGGQKNGLCMEDKQLLQKGWNKSTNRFRELCKDVSNTGSEGLSNATQGKFKSIQKPAKPFEGRESSGTFTEGGKYWSTEPNVGGRFNGLPNWLHRHNIKGYGQEESIRRTEILRELWNNNVSKTIWQVIGGFDQVQKSEILFAFVCKYEVDPNKARIFLEGKEAFEEFVRGLWEQGEITGAPHRSKDRKQFQGKHTDIVQELSRLLAYSGKEDWRISSWEDGIPRVANNIPSRVDRLKGLGNAIVPQVAFKFFKAMK